jgi:hypothetical protein
VGNLTATVLTNSMIHNGFGPAGSFAPPSTAHARVSSSRLRLCRVVARLAACHVVMLLMASSAGFAQSMAGAQRATRGDLSQRLGSLEQQLAGASLKGTARTAAQGEVAAIKARLEVGDFKVGDRFVVTLRFDSISTDTASVRDGLLVALFSLPDVSLKGVLRSELDDRLSSHVARYLRNASIRANVLTRVGVFGAVGAPNYYLVSPDRPISDLIMVAGGPTADANLNQLEIERSGKKVLSAKESKKALKEGKTLEQLDVQSGDDVRIPTKRKINWQLLIQLFFIISSLFFAFIQFIQWYYGRDDG